MNDRYVSRIMTQMSEGHDMDEHYDVGIFSSGYEPRARHAHQIATERGVTFASQLVLGFSNLTTDFNRILNDKYFRKNATPPVILSQDDPGPLWKCLAGKLDLQDGARVMVDYTSMSRTWMSALTNWFSEYGKAQNLSVDWVYSPGKYSAPFSDSAPTKRIRKAAGMFGGLAQNSRTLLVCGVGFDSDAAVALLNHLEPDEVIVVHAINGYYEGVDEFVADQNHRIFSKAEDIIRIPVHGVPRVFSQLREIAQQFSPTHNLVFAELGPKPHYLAVCLLGLAMPKVHVLHVSRPRTMASYTESELPPILTRTVYSPSIPVQPLRESELS